MMDMALLLPVFRFEGGGRDRDALPAHVVEHVHLVAEGPAGKDLHSPEDLFERLTRRRITHPPLHPLPLEPHPRPICLLLAGAPLTRGPARRGPDWRPRSPPGRGHRPWWRTHT